MGIKKKIGFSLSIVVFISVVIGIFMPINYYIEMPGPIDELDRFVTIKGKKDNFQGSFNITTVSERHATPFYYLYAKTQKYFDIVSMEDAFAGQTPEEYQKINEYYMLSAQNAAKAQALKLAGEHYSTHFKGVYVMNVDKKSDFYGKLKVGDTVTGINKKKFSNSEDLVLYIRKLKIGDKVTVSYTRDNRPQTIDGKLMQLPKTSYPGIGISLVDDTSVESKLDITYDSYGITGPSGGLMLTLETYTKLTGKDIRHGQKITGTGTMDFEGNVGRIGGIEKKVVSASKAGSTIFFAPNDEISKETKKKYPNYLSNYEQAKRTAEEIHTNMKIVPVKTAQDALTYLEKLK